jgi:hypothetical protein
MKEALPSSPVAARQMPIAAAEIFFLKKSQSTYSLTFHNSGRHEDAGTSIYDILQVLAYTAYILRHEDAGTSIHDILPYITY